MKLPRLFKPLLSLSSFCCLDDGDNNDETRSPRIPRKRRALEVDLARLPLAKKEKDEIDRALTRTTVLVFALRVTSTLPAANRRGGRADRRR